MSISILNLRTFGIGSKPDSLEPGQICFNLTDKSIFVGDGSDFNTSYNGTTTPGVAGLGWYEMPMGKDGLSSFFLENPASYGDIPVNGQVLSWDSNLNHPVWVTLTPGGPTSGAVYTTTNSAVLLAPGINVTEKINAALQVTPTAVSAVIVSGIPGDLYQGLYYFINGTWTFAAPYAAPIASQVPYSGLSSGIVATNVQGAIDEVNNKASEAVTKADTAITTANTASSTATAAQTAANTALSTAQTAQGVAIAAQNTATTALTTAQQAIPRTTFTAKGQIITGVGVSDFSVLPVGSNGQVLVADSTQPTGLRWASDGGGTVTSVTGTAPITVNNTNPATPVISVDAASENNSGVVQLNNTTSSTSTTQAATANAVKLTYDVAFAALPKAGGTLTGALFSVPLQTPGTTAASDLGLVSEPTTGLVKSVDAFDAGVY